MAALVATRATCLRRSVGCVLVNKIGHVLATGYNGVATGVPHCNEPNKYKAYKDFGGVVVEAGTYPNKCEGVNAAPGESLDKCGAIHAEQNALLQCRNVQEIYACYCTDSPCVTCTKLLMNTSCRRIVFSRAYAHNDPSRKLWRQNQDRSWIHIGDELHE